MTTTRLSLESITALPGQDCDLEAEPERLSLVDTFATADRRELVLRGSAGHNAMEIAVSANTNAMVNETHTSVECSTCRGAGENARVSKDLFSGSEIDISAFPEGDSPDYLNVIAAVETLDVFTDRPGFLQASGECQHGYLPGMNSAARHLALWAGGLSLTRIKFGVESAVPSRGNGGRFCRANIRSLRATGKFRLVKSSPGHANQIAQRTVYSQRGTLCAKPNGL